jgi:hypothetical protein
LDGYDVPLLVLAAQYGSALLVGRRFFVHRRKALRQTLRHLTGLIDGLLGYGPIHQVALRVERVLHGVPLSVHGTHDDVAFLVGGRLAHRLIARR